MKKILLVGESNPYGADPEYALYPLPEHASGGRLQRILGLTMGEYLRRHDRENLCVGPWSTPAARLAANAILNERIDERGIAKDGYGLVLCGRKVTDAFRHPDGLEVEMFECLLFRGVPAAILPHPSARNRIWNDPTNIEKARACYAQLRRFIDDV